MMQTPPSFQHVLRHPLVVAALLTLVMTLALLGTAALFIWQPAQAEAEAAEAALDKASSDLRELKFRGKLAEDYAVRRGQVDALEAKLRHAKPEPEFVRDIEALVAGSGAAVSQFTSRTAEQSGGLSTTYFEFFLNGSYTSLRKFIADLPQLNDFVAIERVSLERSGPAVRAYLVLRRRHKAL